MMDVIAKKNFFNQVISAFTIINTTNLFPESSLFKKINVDTVINKINQYDTNTGIMIGNISLFPSNYYILLFDYNIIFFEQKELHQFSSFFKILNDKIRIYFLNNQCQAEFESLIKGKSEIKNEPNNKNVENSQKFYISIIKQQIVDCIIKKSIIRSYERPFTNFSPLLYKENEFIRIKELGINAHLCFNIKDQFLYVKKGFDSNDYDKIKVFNYEKAFYQKINNQFPLISKCFGQIETPGKKYLIIEYIEGKKLFDYIIENQNKLNYLNKMCIILDIMISIEYLHLNGFVYRDLKWDNIIIDSNNNAILFDFDHSKQIQTNDDMTGDIGNSFFIPPEQFFSNNYSDKNDVYSLGMIIHFILTEKNLEYNPIELFYESKNSQKNMLTLIEQYSKTPEKYHELRKIYMSCFEYLPEKRPNIVQILNSFFFYMLSVSSKNNSKEQTKFVINFINFRANQLEKLYFSNNLMKNEFLTEITNFFVNVIENYKNIFDYKNRFQLLTLCSNLNNYKANFTLGVIYLRGIDVNQDFMKAIHYFQLAAKHKDSLSLLFLGFIYYFIGDINKLIYYFNESANLGNDYAIIFMGKYVVKDINKAIKYFTLSAEVNNNQLAQLILGRIYYENENINKSIHYLNLSASQNNQYAQYFLGKVYFFEKWGLYDITKSIHYFKLSANQNNADAQFLLGKIYYEGKKVSKNINESIHYLKLSANQNLSEAQFLLGYIYLMGIDIPKDIKTSIYYLNLSASQNNKRAQFFLGKLYYDEVEIKQNINKALYYLKLSADQNCLEAQFLLGYIYYKGVEIERNMNKSLYYLTKSADQNLTFSQYLLGYIYNKGKYVSRDMKKSIYYYKCAAKNGNEDSLLDLGEIYISGLVPIDTKQSIYYLELATIKGNSNAQAYLGYLYLFNKNISHDIDKALHYLFLSSNQNNYSAMALLGCIYYTGKFIPKDINKSLYYLTKSANGNNSLSQCYLGEIYYYGQIVPKDINKAIKYFTSSSFQNNAESQFHLGKIYYYGDDNIKQDIKKAINYFERSAENGSHEAQYMLGEIYYFGVYIEKDINKAIHYFKNASNINNAMAKNSLGVIYKNGISVNKNISNAIEYFEEAIKISNDQFSIFNLSRIYYFGIDIQKNQKKAIDLLEKPGEKTTIPSIFFLYYIYFIEENNKASYYKNIINPKVFRHIYEILPKNANIIHILGNFLKGYDLIYSKDFNFWSDFFNYIHTQSFTKIEKKNIKRSIKSRY